MLNNSDPTLAETPGFVQLVGQVSEILQQTMQRTEAYREQRVPGSQTMTSSQRSSLSRGQHGHAREQSIPRPPRRFRQRSHEGRRLFQVATPSSRREEPPLGLNDLRHRLNQVGGRRHHINVHDRIGTPEFQSSSVPILGTGLRPITIRHLPREGAMNQSQVIEPSLQGSKLCVGLTVPTGQLG